VSHGKLPCAVAWAREVISEMIARNFWPQLRQRAEVSTSSRSCTYMLALCGLAAISCGDALVPGSSLDKLEFSLDGTITGLPGELSTAPLRLGLLWVDPAHAGKGNYVSGSDLVRAEIRPDGTYTLGLFGPPPAPAIRALKSSPRGGPTFAFAWGEIILYEDRNADGTFVVGPLAESSPIVAPDVYRGMPVDRVLLFFAETIPPHQQLIPELIFPATKGYHVGLIRCLLNDQSPAVSPVIQDVTPPSATIEVVAPAPAFPNLRSCLQSHPTSRDR
jgi:hypothetical protein